MKTPDQPRRAGLAGYAAFTRRFVPALFAMVAGAAVSRAAETKLDVNDVSFLFPVPTTAAEVDQLISVDETLLPDGAVWPTADFKEVLKKAKSDATKAKGVDGVSFGISFPAELENPHNWKVVGIRVNPASFGATKQIFDDPRQGEPPSFRLVVQPVTVSGGTVQVHDYAAHLAFLFVAQAPPPFKPDKAAFQPVVDDLVEIKKMVEQVRPTAGEIRVHPGFAKPEVAGFRDRLRKLLKDRLVGKRLGVISFMGIPDPDPEPWIFFSVLRSPATGQLELRQISTLPGTNAQMVRLIGGRVIDPQPVANPDTGEGLSMARLFGAGIKRELDKALCKPSSPTPFKDLKLRDLPDLMGNPQFRSTANTDCISCHTDTTRRIGLGIPFPDADPTRDPDPPAAYTIPTGISGGVPKDALPEGGTLDAPSWNLRNFGWFPGKPGVTISRRAANEAAESADYINRTYVK